MDKTTLVWKIKSFEQLSTTELYELLRVRTDVFVVEQQCPYPECDGYDSEAWHLWAEKDKKPVAYCRIFAPGIKYFEASIGRVLSQSEYRKYGLGKALISLALQVIETRFQTSSVRISAQDYLLDFYRSLGFHPTGHHYLEDGIPHTEMLRKF
ncbi:GNAT family N-acetyltransferase [Bergeyella sp. RCAD1439]|uniref:GNAT family N-acetyltransferase n=1 Tax=Bergeyella anatis TaxID=3113737 RepID=UPI002E16F554|nr:GNAT family N-acetyltransferase [Bergeyella sp. RCAD1439]